MSSDDGSANATEGGPGTAVGDGAPVGRHDAVPTGAGRIEGAAYRAPALERGVDALELLALSGTAMTQAEIARALGRSPSELFRVLTVLERRGYLSRDPGSGAYRPTLRLFELSRAHRPEDTLLRAAEAPMRELVDATGEGCHLSVLHRGRLLVLAQEEGPARVRVSVAVGSTVSPWLAASGRVLLAGLSPDERDAALQADAAPATLPEPALATLRARLELVAERGWEDAREESVAGVSDLAVPVGRGATRAAFAVAALPRDHAAWVGATLPLLQRAAAAIARAAGLLVPERDGAEEGGGVAHAPDGPGPEGPG